MSISTDYNPSTVESIVSALSTILDFRSTAESRKSAEKFVEEFKSSPQALPTSIHLVNYQHRYTVDIRLFGLHALEHMLSHYWNAWTPDFRLQYRQSLMTLVAEGLSDCLTEKMVIKEKLSELVVAVALRTWPQDWTELWPTLEMMLSSTKPILIEMALIILRSLAEDVFVYPDPHLEEQRRADLKTSLLAQSPIFLKHLTAFMTSFFKAEQSELKTLLLVDSLKLWAAYVEWIPFKSLEENHISQLMCNWLVKGGPVMEAILDVFLVLTPRLLRPEEQVVFVPLMEKMEFLGVYLKELTSQPFTEANYACMKKLAQILHELGTRQICYKKSMLLTGNELGHFFYCMLFLFNHESSLLSSMTLQFWSLVFKFENVIKTQQFNAMLSQFVAAVTSKLIDSESSQKYHSSLYYKSDFDSQMEYEQFHAAVRNRLYEILRSLAKLQPLEMLQYAGSAFQNFANFPYNVSTVGKDPIGCTVKSPYYVVFEANVLFLDAIISGVASLDPYEPAKQSAMVTVLHQILDYLLAFDQPDTVCLTKLLEGLTSAAVLLKSFLRNLGPVMSKVMPLVTFSLPNVEPRQMNEERKEKLSILRRKAASVLVKLASVFAEQLVPFYPNLSVEIQRLVSVPTLGLGEKSSLIEFLLVICQSAGSDEDKASCYQFICGPLINEWSSPMISESVASVDSLFQWSGAHLLFSNDMKNPSLPSALVDPLEAASKRRTQLLYLCNTSLVVLRRLLPTKKSETLSERATAAASALISLVLPHMFTLIKTLHAIWDPESWASFCQRHQHHSLQDHKEIFVKITELSQEEKKVMLGLGGFDRTENENEAQIDRLATTLRIWLGNLRVTLYSILGTCASFGALFYGHDMVKPFFWTSLFSSIPFIQSRHWRHLIQLSVSPFILQCPLSHFEDALQPWLPAFINFLIDKLDMEWKAFHGLQTLQSPSSQKSKSQNHDDDDDETEDNHLSDELVIEKLVRDLTHSFASLLFDVLVPVSERGMILPKTSTLEHTSPLVKFILLHFDMANPFLNAVLKCYTWQDTYTCDKALTISQRLVAILAGRSEYISFVGRSLAIAGLQTLSEGYHQELHESVLATLVLIYGLSRSEFESVLLSGTIPGVNASSLAAFSTAFDAEKDMKKKKAFMKTLLKPIMGVKSNAWFRLEESQSAIKNLPTRLTLALSKKQPGSADVLGGLGEEGLGLSEFFA